MGNDGGSIPKRRELVKEASRLPSTAELKESLAESQHHAWTHCALSSRPLATPVVSDALGTLYNKDSVLEFLLAEEGSAEKVEGEKVLGGRVKGLRDVVEVKFCVDESEGGKVEGGAEKWVCPVTRVEMGPRSGAVYVVPCGHAFAGSVVREVKDGICVECSTPFTPANTIPILSPLPTTLSTLTSRLKSLTEQGLTHSLKKLPGSKKRKKTSPPSPTSNIQDPEATSTKTKLPTPPSDSNSNSKPAPSKPLPAPSIHNPSTAYLTKKVLAEQEERNKRRKVEENDNVRSLFKRGGGKPDVGNSRDYMTRGFSIGK